MLLGATIVLALAQAATDCRDPKGGLAGGFPSEDVSCRLLRVAAGWCRLLAAGWFLVVGGCLAVLGVTSAFILAKAPLDLDAGCRGTSGNGNGSASSSLPSPTLLDVVLELATDFFSGACGSAGRTSSAQMRGTHFTAPSAGLDGVGDVEGWVAEECWGEGVNRVTLEGGEGGAPPPTPSKAPSPCSATVSLGSGTRNKIGLKKRVLTGPWSHLCQLLTSSYKRHALQSSCLFFY